MKLPAEVVFEEYVANAVPLSNRVINCCCGYDASPAANEIVQAPADGNVTAN